MLNYEDKIWGKTATILQTPGLSFHRAEVNAGFKCSIHRHDDRINGFFVEQGVVKVHVWGHMPVPSEPPTITYTLSPGMFVKVDHGVFHMFECVETGVLFEVYWPPSVRNEDIVRLNEGGPV